MQGEWQIDRARPDDWNQVAALWFGAAVPPEQIASLSKTLEPEGDVPATWWVARESFKTSQNQPADGASGEGPELQTDTVVAVMLVLPQPGALATCWAPRVDHRRSKETTIDIARRLWTHVRNEFQQQGIRLFQALAADPRSAEAQLLRALGFAHITQLLTMHWKARYGMPQMTGNNQAQIVSADDTNMEVFRDTLVQTHVESLDAPELERFQNPDDVLAGYADSYNQRWLICAESNRAVGVMVLSQDGTLGQLNYCGIVPTARQCRMGTFAVHWALQFFRGQYTRRVSVRLDARNTPARRLYESCGFTLQQTEELFISD